MILASKVLRESVIESKAPGSGNTMLQKDFPGGVLVLTGANSSVGLRSMPACYLFLDEAETYEGDVGGEGDPVALAQARSDTYGFRAKQYLPSTPKIAGESRIEAEFLAGDQRRFHVPCPHCDHFQWLKPERFKWPDGPESVHYVCEECNDKIYEHHKTKMLERGIWVAGAEPESPGHRSYQISSFYAPLGWLSWAKIAREWIRAIKRGPEALKTFINTRLGETWKEAGEVPDADRLMERREEFKKREVPSWALAVTAGVDSQGDRLEMYVWAWGAGPRRVLINKINVDLPPTNPEAWRELDRLMDDRYPREDGGYMVIDVACVDTGGQLTASVYRGLMEVRNPRLVPIKGKQTLDSNMPVSTGTFVSVKMNGKVHKRGLRLRNIAVDTFKLELYRMLMQDRGDPEKEFPETWVHLPDWMDREMIEQLVAEKRVKEKTRGGGYKFKWTPHRERNEALDCAVYARAALYLLADARGNDFWEGRRLSRDQYVNLLLRESNEGITEDGEVIEEEEEVVDVDALGDSESDADSPGDEERRPGTARPEHGTGREVTPADAGPNRGDPSSEQVETWNNRKKRKPLRRRGGPVASSYVQG